MSQRLRKAWSVEWCAKHPEMRQDTISASIMNNKKLKFEKNKLNFHYCPFSLSMKLQKLKKVPLLPCPSTVLALLLRSTVSTSHRTISHLHLTTVHTVHTESIVQPILTTENWGKFKGVWKCVKKPELRQASSFASSSKGLGKREVTRNAPRYPVLYQGTENAPRDWICVEDLEMRQPFISTSRNWNRVRNLEKLQGTKSASKYLECVNALGWRQAFDPKTLQVSRNTQGMEIASSFQKCVNEDLVKLRQGTNFAPRQFHLKISKKKLTNHLDLDNIPHKIHSFHLHKISERSEKTRKL